MRGFHSLNRLIKSTLALVCVLSVLPISSYANADIFGDVTDWFSDRAEDVSDAVDSAGEFIGDTADSVGDWISGNASQVGQWISNTATAADGWIGQSASDVSKWIGENASNAGNWIVENGTVVGEWLGKTASGAAMWVGENATAAGTCIGTTATGISIWVNDTVSDIGQWISENALYAKNGIAVLGDNLTEWGLDQADDIADIAEGVTQYVKNIDPSVYLTKEYYIQSGEKLLLGEYTDQAATGLSIGLNLVASIVNLDLLFDLRDLTYDIQYIGDGSIGIVQLGIDAASCLPVIGVIKNVKYLDQVSDAAKLIDEAADIADTGKDISNAAEVVDGIKDAANAVDSAADIAKAADTVDEVTDVAKAADAMDNASDAAKAANAIDNTSEVEKTAESVDDVSDITKGETKKFKSVDDDLLSLKKDDSYHFTIPFEYIETNYGNEKYDIATADMEIDVEWSDNDLGYVIHHSVPYMDNIDPTQGNGNEDEFYDSIEPIVLELLSKLGIGSEAISAP